MSSLHDAIKMMETDKLIMWKGKVPSTGITKIGTAKRFSGIIDTYKHRYMSIRCFDLMEVLIN